MLDDELFENAPSPPGTPSGSYSYTFEDHLRDFVADVMRIHR
ncbi:MAG: hypothetical protein ABI183_05255 [Polyangiaceae bacterium]